MLYFRYFYAIKFVFSREQCGRNPVSVDIREYECILLNKGAKYTYDLMQSL